MPEIPWVEAELACEAEGAHLISVDSSDELPIADAALVGSSNAWLGTSDRRTSGTFLTVTGQPAFLACGSGCVQVVDTGAMAVRVCTDMNDNICEYDGVVVDPSAF